MNSTVYVYGNLGSGYTQYPNDYTRMIFAKFMNQLSLSSSQTEIAVCRDNSLMYYGYVRKLADGQCIGFCVLLNGAMQTDFEGMFALFENAITHLVVNGELLQFNLNGDIVSKVDQLCYNQIATNQIIDFLKDGFHKLEDGFRKLPPVSYSVSSDDIKQFSLSDNIGNIITATHTYRYSYISKDKDINTQSLNSYKGVVSHLNRNCKKLSDELIETRTELVKIKRQKKQFRYVLILLLSIMGCAIGLFSLNDNLNITQGQLNNANSTNSNLEAEVDELKSANIDLQHSLSAEKKRRKDVESKLKQIAKHMPIVVTNAKMGNTNNGVVKNKTNINEDYVLSLLRNPTYYRYHNSRFDFHLTYPSFLVAKDESANGDGRIFSMNNDVLLIVSGINNINNESIIEKYYENDIKSLTYSKLKDNWFIISDHTTDGRVFYQKTVLHNGAFITMKLYYPPKYKREFDAIIKRIFTGFPY